MPVLLVTALRTGLTWLGRIGIAAFAVNEVAKLTTDEKATITEGTRQATAAGVTGRDYAKLVAGTTYDQVEQDGKEPDDFWAGLSETEKTALQFSPETLRQDMGRTKFLGLTSALMFVGALASGGFAAAKGIPILLRTLAKVAEARKAGANALTLMTIFEEGKIAGLAAVWVPAFIAGIASAGGWLTSTMTNNLNDATLWGRIFLGQAADDFVSAQEQIARGERPTPSGVGLLAPRKTIIRMTEEKKPEQFIGTLFSAKLGDMKSFDRMVTDEINDENELREDVKIGLNRWLTTLPGRLGYSVVIRKDPVDEFGVKQSGIWATLTLHITRLNGPIQPIDTILLGPVSPATRLILSKVTKVIEGEIPDMLAAQEVQQITIPSGAVDIFDVEGERIDLAPKAVVKVPDVIIPAGAVEIAAEDDAPEGVEIERIGGKLFMIPTAAVPTPIAKLAEEVTEKLITPLVPKVEEPVVTEPVTEPTPTPTETPQQRAKRLVGLDSVTVGNTDGLGLNMRTGAGTTHGIIVAVPDGTTFSPFKDSATLFANGLWWVHLKPNPAVGMNTAGWAAADFLV